MKETHLTDSPGVKPELSCIRALQPSARFCPCLWSIIAKLSCTTGFLVCFCIKLGEVCKCFPVEWFITSLPGRKPKLAYPQTYEPLEHLEEFSARCPPGVCCSFILALILIVGEVWEGVGVGVGTTFEGWMVCEQQSLISFIFFYSLQAETLYYNAAQQNSLLGDELQTLAFGDNQAKSLTLTFCFVMFFLKPQWVQVFAMLATTQHVQIKILTHWPPHPHPPPSSNQPLCACDHQISCRVRTLWPSGLGDGAFFPVGTCPLGWTQPLLHQEFPYSQTPAIVS